MANPIALKRWAWFLPGPLSFIIIGVGVSLAQSPSPTPAPAGGTGGITINAGLLATIGGFLVALATAYGLWRKMEPERKKLEAETERLEAERQKIINETSNAVLADVRAQVDHYKELLAAERLRASEVQSELVKVQAEFAKTIATAATERAAMQRRIADLEAERAAMRSEMKIAKREQQLEMEAMRAQHHAEVEALRAEIQSLLGKLGIVDRRTERTDKAEVGQRGMGED